MVQNTDALELPLFPLSTVLFPEGRLELRIFEARYLDLVRDCLRREQCFGICLLLEPGAAGEAGAPAAVGTEARICDFCTLPDGLLGITVVGERRFHVERVRVRDNGQLLATASVWPSAAALPVPPEFALLVTILQRLADQDDALLQQADKQRFDDAAWVAQRLAERLPISAVERQQILQCATPLQQLQIIATWLPRFVRE